jgi:uncharacterized lipoprotein YddW (UPF0748 family)
MKIVDDNLVIGGRETYEQRGLLKHMGFRFKADSKVWVQWMRENLVNYVVAMLYHNHVICSIAELPDEVVRAIKPLSEEDLRIYRKGLFS